MLKYRKTNIVDCMDWDEFIKETYKRPYKFQQQDGCKERGIEHFVVPCEYPKDYENDSIPEEVNGEEMGVSFKAWLERDPNLDVFDYPWQNQMFWERNFYPNTEMLLNDLFNKGLIEAGDYVIEIDW